MNDECFDMQLFVMSPFLKKKKVMNSNYDHAVDMDYFFKIPSESACL